MAIIEPNIAPNLPNHVGVIMDGNGRWAQKRNLNREMGHIEGSKAALRTLRCCLDYGIQYLTLYAFSSENWQRPLKEVSSLMKLLEKYLIEDTEVLVENNVKLNAIGNIKSLPLSVQEALSLAMEKTKEGSDMLLTLALSYGSWQEMERAVKNIVYKTCNRELSIKNIDKKTLRNELYTYNIPDPDLLIRTGNELRLSNFMLLQLSYSELYFSQKLWPDFNCEDLESALKSFSQRARRYGRIGNTNE